MTDTHYAKPIKIEDRSDNPFRELEAAPIEDFLPSDMSLLHKDIWIATMRGYVEGDLIRRKRKKDCVTYCG